MKAMRRVLCVLVCLLLAPALALGDAPVTRADFTLTASIDADAFPNPGSRLRDWQSYLDKLSLGGYMLLRDPFGESDFFRMDANLRLNGNDTLPFTLDYAADNAGITSPALGEGLLHASMLNFYEFMLKPYFFMGLRTDLLSLALYPSGAYWVGSAYYTLLRDAFSGEGDRALSYDELHALCLTMDDLIFEEDFQRPYRFIRQLFIGLESEEDALYALSDLESWLDFLDPEQGGLSIAQKDGVTTYVLGETTLMTRAQTDKKNEVTLTLPDADGRALSLRYCLSNNDLLFDLSITRADGDTGLLIMLDAKGLPLDGAKDGEATLHIVTDGAALEAGERFDLTLPFTWMTAQDTVTYTLGYLVPETGRLGAKATLVMKLTENYNAGALEIPWTPFDILGMNSVVLDEWKNAVKKPLIASLAPFAMEMPAGVLNDLIDFAYHSNLLTTLVLE